jgi:hypothetical protein
VVETDKRETLIVQGEEEKKNRFVSARAEMGCVGSIGGGRGKHGRGAGYSGTAWLMRMTLRPRRGEP